ncbi:MAG: cyclic pyranopterin monophosphate synthase MoaC [Syntrophales bacterium]|jgi:cyclic pyranopterin phosphate synthase|nr:cyclic pyranopterin monophosphate synthase MoaC [Syntrophales bacterium]MCK9528416.1 cyclic pyranopterin monophosphate synthase MoaC [Syntrophales bacterium]MDX9922439.1 cyclic pyranopterin monophosphate synthase MoaC [Syntrophales bacterium]
MTQFSHLDKDGAARMVDVSAKAETSREAVARGVVRMKPETSRAIMAGGVAKGDVLGTAKIAGIMAAKKTSHIIPLCHPLELTSIDLSFSGNETAGEILIEATAKTIGRTGVEMEAMTAVAAAALTIYDMCKSADREMVIGAIRLVKKSGGKSGTFLRVEEQQA